MPQWTVWDLQEQLSRERNLIVLDVRQPQEWTRGHIEQARHITGAELPQRLTEVPQEQPVAIICGSGYRSSVSASLLAQRGHKKVVNVLGGLSVWQRAELPTVD